MVSAPYNEEQTFQHQHNCPCCSPFQPVLFYVHMSFWFRVSTAQVLADTSIGETFSSVLPADETAGFFKTLLNIVTYY